MDEFQNHWLQVENPLLLSVYRSYSFFFLYVCCNSTFFFVGGRLWESWWYVQHRPQSLSNIVIHKIAWELLLTMTVYWTMMMMKRVGRWSEEIGDRKWGRGKWWRGDRNRLWRWEMKRERKSENVKMMNTRGGGNWGWRERGNWWGRSGEGAERGQGRRRWQWWWWWRWSRNFYIGCVVWLPDK